MDETKYGLSPYSPGSTEGLPESARQRLAGMRGGKDERRDLFTSDLSVNEFLLVRDAGFEALGLVMGCSIFHIGFQFRNVVNVFESREMDVLTQALYSARELAMTRMQEEADLLGADGIVGVRLKVNRHAFGKHLAEFLAIGTAIRHRGSTPENEKFNYRTRSNRPFTSDLSGQEFWTLLRSGYRPVSLVMGNCVYRVAWQGVAQSISQFGRNVEMQNYTQALYDARELALERMQAEAESGGAEGIVSAEIQESNHGWSQHIIEYFAIGTAISPISEEHTIPTPQITLSLNDKPQRSLP